MAVISELIRSEADGSISFGDYTLADKKKLAELICKGMDPCVAPICNAMNLVPDVRTNSSCEGHEDEDEFYIMFYCIIRRY